jgi:hypothetical protein
MFLNYLFKNIDVSGLAKFVSPQFFKVMPVPALMRIATQLNSNQKNLAAWHLVAETHRKLAAEAELGVELVSAQIKGSADYGSGLEFPRDGSLVLETFFFQILTGDFWILDFRSRSFSRLRDGYLNWRPALYFLEMDADFTVGIRALYRGFYGDDPDLFSTGIQKLNLEPAREALRRHFGEGDQRQVKFSLKQFQNTFADIFQACAADRLKLHPGFLPLGMMLLGLYELLERSEMTYDVRTCFRNALEKAERRT